MHILFFTHYFPPESNAPASRVFEMAKRWVRAGHRVQVITCAPNVPDGRGRTGTGRETLPLVAALAEGHAGGSRFLWARFGLRGGADWFIRLGQL